MHAFRTHDCGALRQADVGATVRLSGWLHRRRDHGGLLFVDLRDHYGITQCVVEPDQPGFTALEHVRAESVITITGPVVARSADTVNRDLPTGEVEVRIEEVALQSAAEELPVPVFGDVDYPEETRLRYRFLDLRRDKLHRQIMLRSNVIASIRRRMIKAGFFEFQTPILTASSPEGARDFLVPSRLHPGKFYALPQAPQQFKQLIMVAGFDRYFQIAPCFRDEDPRADRSPGEFYQLDVEMSFVEQEDVFQAIEPVIHGVFEEFAGGKTVTPTPFPRISYKQSLLQYGSDKPDMRIPILCSDVTQFFAEETVTFNAFKNVVKSGGVVRAILAPGAAAQPRSFFDKLNEWARKEMRAPGLGYIVFEAEGAKLVGKGPIAKFIPEDVQGRMAAHAGIKAGDALFFSAGKEADAVKLAGPARNRIGEELGLKEKGAFRFCWVIDFPMYEWNEDEKRIDFSHNPFSMPNYAREKFLKLNPQNKDEILGITAFQYDIVCNGVELCSGAIRNHRPDVMLKAFDIAGHAADAVEARFGGMLNAFRYGAPPHGGLAPGIDRIVMLLAEVDNLREVIMFPMNQQAQDLMMGAPSEVAPKQLRELHLRIALPPAPELPKT
jgi:aspartyl-tRNA synthetase